MHIGKSIKIPIPLLRIFSKAYNCTINDGYIYIYIYIYI